MFVPPHLTGRLCVEPAVLDGLSPAAVCACRLDGQPAVLKSIGEEFAGTTYSVRREAAVMRWLDGRLSVPRVLDDGVCAGREYLVMTRLAGRPAEAFSADPELYASLLARAVQAVQSVDIAKCPFQAEVSLRLRELAYLLENGLADTDPENWEPDTAFDSPAALYRWLCENRPAEELVFSHGDLPANFLVGEDSLAFFDLARAGLADRWLDIAFCVRDIRSLDGSGALERLFFKKLGLQPDYRKIEYFILLDELF